MCSRSYWHFGRSVVREGLNKNRKIWRIKIEIKNMSHFQLGNFITEGALKISRWFEFQYFITDPCRLKTSKIPILSWRLPVWLFGYMSECSEFQEGVKYNWRCIQIEKRDQFFLFLYWRVSLRGLFQILNCKRSRFWNNFIHMFFFGCNS